MIQTVGAYAMITEEPVHYSDWSITRSVADWDTAYVSHFRKNGRHYQGKLKPIDQTYKDFDQTYRDFEYKNSEHYKGWTYITKNRNTHLDIPVLEDGEVIPVGKVKMNSFITVHPEAAYEVMLRKGPVRKTLKTGLSEAEALDLVYNHENNHCIRVTAYVDSIKIAVVDGCPFYNAPHKIWTSNS